MSYKEIEAFRFEYEDAVRQRDLETLLKFYDEEFRSQVQDRWQFLFAQGWGVSYFLDDNQAQDYSQFKLLMDICEIKDGEAIAILAHDTGYPFVNRYLVSRDGADVYRLVRRDGEWKIFERIKPDELYDIQHHDMKVQIFPDTGEMEVEQEITAKRLAEDGKLFFSILHEGWKIESIESPQGDLTFSQLASTVAVKFNEEPTSDIIHLLAKYRGKAGEWFVNEKFPEGTYINVQRIEPGMAIVREENVWYLRTDPATAKIAIRTPKGYKAICSRGLLTSTIDEENTTTYVWENNEPASDYGFLACDDWTIHSKKVGEITLSVYLRAQNKSEPEEIMENAEEILSVFNKLYGPTKPRRFALVDAPFGWNRPNYVPIFEGGRVSVHEMAHYWWTGAFKSVERPDFDWFSEGFATYSEALYAEVSYEVTNAKPQRRKNAFHERVANSMMAYLRQDSKTDLDDAKILLKSPDIPTRYSKGACVVHALRFVLGDDNFFQLLRRFIAEYKNKPISVSKFKKMAEEIYGSELGWFFSQWLERPGLPEYKLTVDKVDFMADGSYKVIGQIEQLRELYKMPLEIVIMMRGKQKSERLWVEERTTPFEIITPEKPISVELDPYNWVIKYDMTYEYNQMKNEALQLAEEGKYCEALEKYAESVKLAEDGAIMLPPNVSRTMYCLRERAYHFFNVTHHLIANHQDDEISCELEQLPPPDLFVPLTDDFVLRSAIGFREFLTEPSPKSIKLNLINDASLEITVTAIHRGYISDEGVKLYIDIVKFQSEEDVASFFDNNQRGYVSGNIDSKRKINVGYTVGSEKDNCAMAY